MKTRALKEVTAASLTAIAFVLADLGAARAQELSADLVILNANIITVDQTNPRAEALAVRRGIIVAVGTTSRIQTLVGKDTNIIDAQGKTVTPGFNDAHMHPRAIYPFRSVHHVVDLRPESVATMDKLVNALREKARITSPGQWIRGSRYQDTKLGRHPTRFDLDRASTEHPIRIGHSSGHVSVVNSYALQIAGITKDTLDPPGGGFDRDKEGKPTGICWEEPASSMVVRAGPSTSPPTRKEEVEGFLLCFKNFLTKGITSISDASTNPNKIRLYQDALEAGQPVRVNMMVRQYRSGSTEGQFTDMEGDRWGPSPILRAFRRLGIRTGFGNDRLKIGPVKIVHGNSLSGRTCWLVEPYKDRPDYYGIPPGRSQEDLDRLIFEIHQAGFQAAVHSNGDREIEMLLDAFEKALEKLPKKDHRHRIEHCSIVNDRILERIKKLGLVLVPHSYVYEHGDKMEAYGKRRWGMMHPNRSALELGIPVAGNSDYGVSAADPLLRIQSMVTRKSAEGKVYGPEQRVSVEDAIRIWTLGSAYASFDEDKKGSIEVGKLADCVILSKDPTKVQPDTIKDIKVEKTIIGGKIVAEL